MWVAKLRLKHDDCVIGRRCKRFNVVSIGIPFNSYRDGDKAYFSHFETLVGDEKAVELFIGDLKGDPTITNLEVQGNSIFFLNELSVQQTIPTTHYNPKIFFIKPVVVDNKGYESWEIGSWDEQLLRDFIVNLQKEHFEVKILKIQDEKINQIYFPQVMPFLTKGQKRALEIATQRGYYDFPRNVELKDLAAEAGISLSTFREHLRRAEKKIMPDLVKNVRDE
ncbi:MAG: helix-turn-helix domain-containing protein [Nanoarchaeota archaeon]|nr:helix-turn-helix domain-containing protein [Nanoarchaeota archaeon]MBU1004775.1 helix-turn-helix domain-containing protein [Nanoarchaeota archaeon]MBU1946452.1 helix-turn-helix domain-containing protein [Nanoarchaeota archaeon]